MKAIGVFGGTFDPIHNGHIQMAMEAKASLGLDELRLVPCHIPSHRDEPHLNSQQRLTLVRLAVANKPGLRVDDREIKRNRTSYTVDTLEELRAELGWGVSLVLLMGVDAYNQLMTWHRWQALLDLTNIVIVHRPGYQLPSDGILANWVSRDTAKIIHQQSAGAVLVVKQTEMDVASTEIRKQLFSGQMPDALEPTVKKFIIENELYGFKSRNNDNRN